MFAFFPGTSTTQMSLIWVIIIIIMANCGPVDGAVDSSLLHKSQTNDSQILLLHFINSWSVFPLILRLTIKMFKFY